MPYADQQAMYDHIDELSQYNAELKLLEALTVWHSGINTAVSSR